MNNITVDSRECGAGKTHGINGIFDRISENLSNNQKTIVALPSIILMSEYKEYFLSAVSISSETDMNVQSALHFAVNENVSLILITHKALLDSEIPYEMRKNYDLIIDEVIDPWRFHPYEEDANDKVFDWKSFIDEDKPLDEDEYTTVTFNNLMTNSVTRNNEFIRDITSYNWVNYVKEDGIRQLLNKEKTKINVILELDPLIFSDWNSIHIAAAYFNKTFMSWWMRKHNINYEETMTFRKHTIGLTVYYPDQGQGGWTWSRNKKSTMDWLQNQFYDFVNAEVNGNKFLRLKNNIDRRFMTSNEELLPHNSAGMNKWTTYEYVMLESSLNANPELEYWFRKIIADYYPKMTPIEVEQKIFGARTGYTYYQSLMRCSIRARQPKEATAFTIDKRAVIEMADYFQNYEINDWSPNQPSITKKEKPEPLTQSERQRVSRYRKKCPEICENKTPREILNMSRKD